ncbi:MAG: valine--tRNA ligase [bacterium]
MSPLPQQYQPREYEEAIYKKWERSGAFTADNTSHKKAFTISMPPPNATGELHLGHALFVSIQDALTRYHRMIGEETLWLPGADHAAIATESVVIRRLRQQGIKDPRRELGREELIKRIARYVENSRNTIRSQIRSMGASCDWSRERYTLEPALSRIVALVFKKMYEDGLIYRGHRIVNWDPFLQTTVSDDELERREEKAPFYKLQYGPFAISTARPETKFGDKYVVMHPDDKRYKKYRHGDTFEAEWINGPITATIIKDKAADPEFGTGVMTITPWHDAIDFDIAERHGLDKKQIIDFEGKLLPIAGEFAGLPIAKARPKIVNKLKDKGLLLGIDENYVHNITVNSRGKGVIEPQIKLQWFIDVNKKAVTWQGKERSLKEVMFLVVHSGDINILPSRFKKTYFHWIVNLHDWCISRQIWWGHRIPVWYKEDKVHVDTEPPAKEGWQQDSDTLDTWFSSALWTWSTLIDRDLALDANRTLQDMLAGSPDYKKFHPTSVMETGYDIIFFWVARMILITTYITGQVPFKDVYLHGLIAAKTGRKMSKSDPESMVDPLETIKEFGSDATRFGLLHQLTYGSQVIKADRESIKAARNFANKVWNLARLLQSLPEQDSATIADRWIEQRSQHAAAEVTGLLNEYKLGEAARALYEFVWNDFADWYVEILKTGGSTKVAHEVFINTLKLLHPFLPHLTELLWEHFEQEGMLITSAWFTPAAASSTPGVSPSTPGVSPAAVTAAMSHFQDIVVTVRSARVLLDIPPQTIIDLSVDDPTEIPDALAKLCRARLVDTPAKTMKQFPLQGGGVVSIGAREITASTIKQARQKLIDQEKQLNKFIKQQTQALSTMRDKAPGDIMFAKEAAIAQAKLKIKELAKSKKLL